MNDKTTPSTQVHHIVPISVDKRRRLDRSNLIAVCEECHKAIEGKPDPRLCGQGKGVRLSADGGWVDSGG